MDLAKYVIFECVFRLVTKEIALKKKKGRPVNGRPSFVKLVKLS